MTRWPVDPLTFSKKNPSRAIPRSTCIHPPSLAKIGQRTSEEIGNKQTDKQTNAARFIVWYLQLYNTHETYVHCTFICYHFGCVYVVSIYAVIFSQALLPCAILSPHYSISPICCCYIPSFHTSYCPYRYSYHASNYVYIFFAHTILSLLRGILSPTSYIVWGRL